MGIFRDWFRIGKKEEKPPRVALFILVYELVYDNVSYNKFYAKESDGTEWQVALNMDSREYIERLMKRRKQFSIRQQKKIYRDLQEFRVPKDDYCGYLSIAETRRTLVWGIHY